MADFNDVATNADIGTIADAIRRVTRTVTPMSIPQMPERLLDIRVVEVSQVQVTTTADQGQVELFEYDDTIKHLFTIVPSSQQTAQFLAYLGDVTASCSNGKCYLNYAVRGVRTLSFQVIDTLLPLDESTVALIVKREGTVTFNRLSSHEPAYDILMQDYTTGIVYRRSLNQVFNDIVPEDGIGFDYLDEEVTGLIQGATQADSVASYSELVTKLLALDEDAYNVGQSIYIGTTEVPDVWVYSKSSEYVEYVYTTDAAFIAALNAGGTQVGYFVLYPLETEKVDITGKLDKVTTSGDKRVYAIAADGSQTVFSLAFERGTGVESARLVTTRSWDEEEQQWVDRTNTVAGDYSAAIGSRITVGAKASESLAVGGLIEHYGQNGLSAGYRVEVRANQSITGGYRVVNKASESIQVGDHLLIDGTITFDADGSPSSDSRHNAQFGMYCEMGVGTQACFQSGERITQGTVCKWNAEFGCGHTIGGHCECVSVFDYSNTIEAYITDSLIAGYDNVARNKNGSSSNKKYDIYMFGHENTNRSAASVDYSNVYFIGRGLRPAQESQIVVGQYNLGVAGAIFEVGYGSSSSSRKSPFFVEQTSGTFVSNTAPQLIVSSGLDNADGGKVAIKLHRGANTSWEISVDHGNFFLKDLESDTVALQINEVSQCPAGYRPTIYGNRLAYSSDLSGKVDIVDTGDAARVYGVNASNQQTLFPVSTAATADALVLRGASGRAQVAAPASADDIVNLGYMTANTTAKRYLHTVDIELTDTSGNFFGIRLMAVSDSATQYTQGESLIHTTLLSVVGVEGYDSNDDPFNLVAQVFDGLGYHGADDGIAFVITTSDGNVFWFDGIDPNYSTNVAACTITDTVTTF